VAWEAVRVARLVLVSIGAALTCAHDALPLASVRVARLVLVSIGAALSCAHDALPLGWRPPP
jgi:hypothetical protein